MNGEMTKPVDERAETVARVLREHQLDNLEPEWACVCGQALPASSINDDPLITRLYRHQSAAIVAALDDAIVPATDDAACPRCGCPNACPEGELEDRTAERNAAQSEVERLRVLANTNFDLYHEAMSNNRALTIRLDLAVVTLEMVEAKLSEWEQIGRNFKRESPATSATIRNVTSDLRAILSEPTEGKPDE